MHKQISSSEANLVAYWRFNESSGTSAVDETSNNHDGTLNNMTDDDWVSSTAPIGGYALDFDGSDDYVDCGDHDDFSFGNSSSDNPFTIEAWIKMDDATNFVVLSKGEAWTTYEYYFGETNSDKFELTLRDNSEAATIGRSYNTALTSYEGKWIHLSSTYDGSKSSSGIKIYMNGQRIDDTDVNNGSYTAMENLSGSVYIGRYKADLGNGLIDEVRIWNVERSQSQIQENMFKELSGSETGLVAYYKFNEGTGTTVDNSEGTSALDGTLTGFSGTYWVTTIAPLATTFTSDKTDLVSVWSADNSNASSILTITDAVTGSDRIAFGHDNGSLSPNTSDKPDGIDRRLNRVWRVEVNAGLTGDFIFDCSDLGIGTSGNLRLLEDLDGTFSDATAVSGDYSGTDFTVSGQTFKDGYYYTLGSTSSDNSLPVGLSDFHAIAGNERITLKWITESEIDNLGFNIYRSVQSNSQYTIINNQLIPGAGNSSSKKDYEFTDLDVINGITYRYKLEDVDFAGNGKLHGPVSAIPMKKAAPKEFRLYPNYPNPFNPVTTISYDLPEEGYVELTVYNIRGERVKTLLKGFQEVGSYQLSWDGRDQNSEILSSGIYLLQISTGKYLKTNKMIFIR